MSDSPPTRGRLLRDLGTTPNLISLARIAMIITAALLFIEGYSLVGLFLGTAAGLTDYLDGYIARRTGQVTDLGAVLDRFSDLIFESTAILVGVLYSALHPLALYAYLFREFEVLSVRLYCAERGVTVSSSLMGKMKTNFFGYSFFVLFLGISRVLPWWWAWDALHFLATFGILAGLLCSYVSGYEYTRAFVRAYNADQK